jgi:hypothetical protein
MILKDPDYQTLIEVLHKIEILKSFYDEVSSSDNTTARETKEALDELEKKEIELIKTLKEVIAPYPECGIQSDDADFLQYFPNLTPNPKKDFSLELNETEDEIIISNYIGEKKTVVIPDTIDGLPVTAIRFSHRTGAFAFLKPSFCYDVKKIFIPDTVKVIAPRTFFNNKILTAVRLSKNITEIQKETFAGCTSLQFINIHENLTSIDESAFEGCDKLNLKAKSAIKKIAKKSTAVPENPQAQEIKGLLNSAIARWLGSF